MTDRIQRPEIAFLVQNVLPVLNSQYDFPLPEDEEHTKIDSIPVRIGSGIKKPDTVYYWNEVPVFLVEAKRDDKPLQDAIDQALSYIRNYPVERFSKDGIRPRLFAVTIGRDINFYIRRYEILENGELKDWHEEIKPPNFKEILQIHGLEPVAQKEQLSGDAFLKEIIYELTAIYKLGDTITPTVIKSVSQQILSYLKYGGNFVSRQPYVSLDSHRDRQTYIRNLFNRFDIIGSLGPDVARAFREYVLRSFQGDIFNQYLTEPCVIEFMFAILGDISAEAKILDFECGSGGFLVEATRHGARLENIRGVDIEELPYTISATYLALYFGQHGEVLIDALPVKKDNGLVAQGNDWDIVIGNPAGSNDYEHGDLRRIFVDLDKDLDRNDRPDRLSEYNLSIQRSVHSARVGGQICIILPEGLFTNNSDGYLRQYVGNYCKIKAIVSLPPGSFLRGTSTRGHASGAQSAKMKMTILYVEKFREITDGGVPDDSVNLDYPVFLASIAAPEPMPRGDISSWLKPRLDVVLGEWVEWRSSGSLSGQDIVPEPAHTPRATQTPDAVPPTTAGEPTKPVRKDVTIVTESLKKVFKK